MKDPLVGRGDVIETATQLLAGSAAVVVEGPAGIGKTAVWRTLVAGAEARGELVLTAAPTEAESELPYAALADVLGRLADRVADLPAPQRTAARVVLLAAESDQPIDGRAIAAATRSLFESAAADSATAVLYVDDASWLDGPSARALAFALRRCPALPVLVTCRSEDPDPPVPLDLDRGARSVHRVRLGPLGVGPLHHIIRARLGSSVSRPLLTRIVEESGGNPLLSIELTRAALRLPRLPLATDDLPGAGASVQQLVTETLAALPRGSRDAIRLSALMTVPRLADLAAAGVDLRVFDPAEEAGLVALGRDTVEFAHPFYASAVRNDIPPGVRRRLHAALAATVSDPDERARQLAAGVTRPDPAAADELAAAAARQLARGAPGAAYTLYQRAAELGAPAGPDRYERRLAAAQCLFASGDYHAAGSAARALAADASGEERARALLLCASVAWTGEDPVAGSPAQLAEAALSAAPHGSPLAGRIHAHLAVYHDAAETAAAHAREAVALLSGSDGDDDLLSAALFMQLFQEVRVGVPADTGLLERGLTLEAGKPTALAGTVPAIWWKGTDDYERARSRLTMMLDLARAHGDEPWQLELLTHLGETELLAGRWAAAEHHIEGALELGQELEAALMGETWLRGMLDAHRGRLDEARAVAEGGLRTAAALGDGWCRRIHLHLSGFVELSAGRMAEAAEAYTALAAAFDELHLVESLTLRFEPDWIEACVAAGDLDTAQVALDRLAGRDRRLPRPWTRLGVARSALLIAGARGDDNPAAYADLDAALTTLPPDLLPLDRARCLLVAGVTHRRARRKREAREALTAARAGFEVLGAASFVDRANRELSRIGGRPPAPLDLTATEAQVARLAALGHTNRAIADEVFLSPKTVEANLARVYRKLGIERRAQIAAAMEARAR